MGFTAWNALVRGEGMIWFWFFLGLQFLLCWLYFPDILKNLLLASQPGKLGDENKS